MGCGEVAGIVLIVFVASTCAQGEVSGIQYFYHPLSYSFSIVFFSHYRHTFLFRGRGKTARWIW